MEHNDFEFYSFHKEVFDPLFHFLESNGVKLICEDCPIEDIVGKWLTRNLKWTKYVL